MTRSKVLTIGAPVTCEDGECGELHQLVVDPLAGTVTHLVVEPASRRGAGRLVPVGLVSTAVPELRLTCTLAQFQVLEPAEDTEFLPGAPVSWDLLRSGQVLSWPYYGLASGGGASVLGGSLASCRGVDPGFGDAPELLIEDRVPVGEIEVRRGQRVHATDGDIGAVEGLVIDTADLRVSHVLLEEGHLWAGKTVAIPFSEVRSVEDGVAVGLTREQVRDLPPVDTYQFA